MQRPWRPPPNAQLETDPRFPSGKWTGFWLQRAYPTRQWMSLALTFFDGQVRGEGSDVVGDFTVAGQYELPTGNCTLVKTYVGAHDVLYEGRNEEDGMWIWGLWRLGADRGGFHLWPAGEEDPTGRMLKAAKELGAPAQRRVRLEPVGEP